MDASLKRPTASGDDSFGSRGLDSKHLFFTNLQLLGFDAAAMEMKYRIPFNKDMFNLPNKTGSEAVLYFLFSRLNPVMCRQEFRDCWPIVDKKAETQFRRLCCMWLQNIQKDEADSNLPRINASLFLSPGGEKFCQLIFYFSVYVLRHVMKTEAGIKEEELLHRPVITPQNRELFPAILKTVQCESIRSRKILLLTLRVLNAARQEWQEYSEELVKEIRLLTKRIQELQYRKQKEMYKLTQKISIGSPKPKFQPSTGSDIDVNAYAAECAQRVQRVRKMWKSIEHFIESTAEQREIVSSVINRTQQRCVIDAADIKVSVPHFLLKECELEIRRRQVDNIYEGGQLNLLSLLHLWNQALIMYINYLQSVGLRDLSNEAAHLKTQKATLQAYISNAASLRETVSKQLPQKKERVLLFFRRQFHSGTILSQGLGLQAPSPPVTFDPPEGHSGTTPTGQLLRLTPEYENTLRLP
ncbi:HAUS augmin-like complex subunit 6 [Pomacea canaliculata]|uniref:HAUS augmin-like complex subunit 6 n=1 Tax=Pomacea canaliculata TaxID=400727 RepID=UPI000D733BF4|nr:HAUS augmin-like complex subunit 6 [Pomacea canaliculata]